MEIIFTQLGREMLAYDGYPYQKKRTNKTTNYLEPWAYPGFFFGGGNTFSNKFSKNIQKIFKKFSKIFKKIQNFLKNF